MYKLLSIISLFLCLFIFYPESSVSNSTGSPGGKTGSPIDNSDCTSCHGVNSTNGNSSISSNIPASGYVPGTVYTIIANINNASTFNTQGFEITSEENTNNAKTGTFFITDPSTTQLVNNGNAVTHTAGGNNLNSWEFDWEAPSSSSGDVTFYGAFIEAGYPLGTNFTDYFSSASLTVSPSCIDPSLIDSTAICNTMWDPVCGCDSVTYSNDCHAINFGGVTSWTQGPCASPTSCDVEILGDSIICSFSTTQVLTATANGGTPPYTYTWNNGLSNTSILTIISPGTYCVTLTDANGCTATDCITVSVGDIPIYSVPSPPIICVGDSIILEIDTVGLSNIVWVPLGTINTFDRVVDFPLISTMYVVEAIDLAGCDRRGELEVIIDTCATSVMNIAPSQVLIFPNPSKGKMTISLPDFEFFDLVIYDIMGKIVLSESKVSQQYIIAENTLENGSFILQLIYEKGIITKKLIIE
tara:strand:+ start:41231 stop:42643 length:1413 start_codon:yes stop_codon:yes gene_type:complete